MPSVQELVRWVKHDRSRIAPLAQNLRGDQQPMGWCTQVQALVDMHRPYSHLWTSSDTFPKENEYGYHVVGVIGIRRKSGVVINYSGPRRTGNDDIVLANVTDIDDEAAVERVLRVKTGRIDWKQVY